jgi:hypothetical protein
MEHYTMSHPPNPKSPLATMAMLRRETRVLECAVWYIPTTPPPVDVDVIMPGLASRFHDMLAGFARVRVL